MQRGPKQRPRYLLDGEMLTISDVSARTGLTYNAIYSRVARGIPLDKPRGWCARGNAVVTGTTTLYPFNGELKTAAQWARKFGVSPQCIRSRANKRMPLDGSGVEEKPLGERRLGRTANEQPSVFNDALRPDDDRAVREVEAYLSRATLLMTDEEIRAQFADLGRLSDAGVDWAREQAEAILFHHFKLGDGESLEMIGDLHGFCRERARQLEVRATRRLRKVLEGRGLVSILRAELRDRDARRKATWAEVIDMHAPGSFDG